MQRIPLLLNHCGKEKCNTEVVGVKSMRPKQGFGGIFGHFGDFLEFLGFIGKSVILIGATTHIFRCILWV